MIWYNLVVLLFVSSQLNLIVAQKYCYQTITENEGKSQIWKLVFADDFNSDKSQVGSLENWNVKHETAKCADHRVEQESCSVKSNVLTANGYALLMAKHEKYGQYEFTGVTISSNTTFSNGRFEIRARKPAGAFINGRIFLQDLENSDTDLIDIAQLYQSINSRQGVRYKGKYTRSKEGLLPEEHDNGHFHTYGLEWQGSQFAFFFDREYSEKIEVHNFTDSVRRLNLVLQIKVGSRKPKNRRNVSHLDWECPILFIDYVKVYERVDIPVEVASYNECEARGKGHSVDWASIEKFCAGLLMTQSTTTTKVVTENVTTKVDNVESTESHSITPGNSSERQESLNLDSKEPNFQISSITWILVAILALLIIFLLALAYMLTEIKRVKNDSKQESAKFWARFSRQSAVLENYYDSLYDTVACESDKELDSSKTGQAEAQMNEYVAIFGTTDRNNTKQDNEPLTPPPAYEKEVPIVKVEIEE